MALPHVAIAVLSGTTGGPATYGRKLVGALARTGEVRLSILTDRADLLARDLGGASVDLIDLPMRGGIDRLRWQHRAVPRALRELAPDVYHDTKNALPRRLRCPAAVTVHDLAYCTVPETFGLASRMFLRMATRDAARRAKAIIVPSRSTAADLGRFYPTGHDNTFVVPHGIDAARDVDPLLATDAAKRLGLPEHYVLHVGTIQARKNVDLVIQAVRKLRSSGSPHRAVIVGRRGWLSQRAFAEIKRDDTAHWIEHVTDADLAVCYQRAAAFVSPSAYEGFGFAVADALAAGVPTVVADISSLPELCGEAAELLPDLRSDTIAEVLGGLLGDPARRQRLAQLGEARAAGFTWEACADGHLRAYAAARG